MLPAHGPAGYPAGYSFSEWPDSTRDYLPNPSRTGGRTPSRDCDAGRSKPQDGKSNCVDQDELRQAATGGTRTSSGHGPVHAAPSFPGADRDEPRSVSKAVSVAGSAGTHAG